MNTIIGIVVAMATLHSLSTNYNDGSKTPVAHMLDSMRKIHVWGFMCRDLVKNKPVNYVVKIEKFAIPLSGDNYYLMNRNAIEWLRIQNSSLLGKDKLANLCASTHDELIDKYNSTIPYYDKNRPGNFPPAPVIKKRKWK